MAFYNLSPIFQPQFVGSAAAALTLAPAPGGAPTIVPPLYAYQIGVLHVTNVSAGAVSLTIWRVPAGAANDNQHVVVPATVTIPVASATAPHFDVTALWGAVLMPGDAIWALAGAPSTLSIQGDGAVITL